MGKRAGGEFIQPSRLARLAVSHGRAGVKVGSLVPALRSLARRRESESGRARERRSRSYAFSKVGGHSIFNIHQIGICISAWKSIAATSFLDSNIPWAVENGIHRRNAENFFTYLVKCP